MKTIPACMLIAIPLSWEISVSLLDASRNCVSAVCRVHFDHLGSDSFLFFIPDICLVEYYIVLILQFLHCYACIFSLLILHFPPFSLL